MTTKAIYRTIIPTVPESDIGGRASGKTNGSASYDASDRRRRTKGRNDGE